MKNFLSLSRSLVLVWLCAISSFVAAQPYAYVPNAGESDMPIINTANNSYTLTQSLGGNPHTIAVNPDGTKAYIGIHVYAPDTLIRKTLVLNTSNNLVTDTIDGILGRWISPDGSKIYGLDDVGIYAINTANNTVEKLLTPPSGYVPINMAVSPDGKRLYVAYMVSNGSPKVRIIDVATLNTINTINTPSTVDFITDLAVTPDGSKLYIAHRLVDPSYVRKTYVWNTSTNAIVANISDMGEALRVSPDGSKLYAVDEDKVRVMNTSDNTIVATIPVPYNDWYLTLDVTTDGSKLYVPKAVDSPVLTVINTATNNVTATIDMFSSPCIYGNMMPKVYPAVPCSSVSIFPNNVAQINNGSKYVQSLVQTGMVMPTWTVSAGTLPPGISLNGSFLTGTCTANGTYSFTVTATQGTCSVSKSYTVSVSCATASITTASSLGSTIPGLPFDKTLAQTGLVTPIWSVSGGTLPPGITLNASTGQLSGTPTTAGTYNFTVSVGQGSCVATTKNFSLEVVSCPTASITTDSSSLSSILLGAFYTKSINQTGYNDPVFSISAGALPPGLYITDGGNISGYPSSQGVFSFTVMVKKGLCFVTKNFVLQVSCPTASITNSSPLGAGTVGSS